MNGLPNETSRLVSGNKYLFRKEMKEKKRKKGNTTDMIHRNLSHHSKFSDRKKGKNKNIKSI